ncbi:hypothetical protein WG68_11815 [Arsukibacterium ikkense]|uniref:Uncharacterized protein n=1 Tax=Arsukibacterium ikkense TaxID=336831 RepID=A0A0M2V3B0_9GAMM|nr:hypothetical protein [Arsukibacterium ikkense]KKO45116.1 hypothetical protein WG68_11815 [Arsukibacterium ikkense]
MLFFRVIFVVSCFASNLSYANDSLPPVLNSYPKCEYPLLMQARASDKAIVMEDNIEDAKQALLQNAIIKVRQQAAAAGADAVILTEVQGIMGNSQSLRTIRHSGFEVKYSLTGELISLCQEDLSLPTVYTPYSSAGVRQGQTQQQALATNIQFEISIPVKNQQASEKLLPLAEAISLTQGFYGAEPGMSTEQVQTLFGTPDAVLTLKNNNMAWIYGQEHLVIFAGSTAVAFQQSNHILSAEIKMRLVENLRFQQHNWQLDNRFGRRTAIADIRAFYQEQLIQLDQYQFALQRKDRQLILEFAPYLDVKSSENQLQLVNISLLSRPVALEKIQLKLPSPDELTSLKSSLAKLATLAAAGSFTIPQNTIFNRIQLRDGNELSVLTPTLAVSYRNGNIAGLRVTNIINDYAVSDIQQQLALLALPASRDDFMAQFPDAFDSLNQLTLYGDNVEIKATYNNEGLLDSLNINWY